MIISFQSADGAYAHQTTQRALERCRSAGFGRLVSETSRHETAEFYDALKLLIEAAGVITSLAELLAPIVRDFLATSNENRVKFETDELSLELTMKVHDDERVQKLLRRIFEAVTARG
jgi:hypothetical protein